MEITIQIKKGNKTMKEMKKNRNSIKAELGYNFCPKCGSQAYAVTTEDGMHRVGCIYCGFINGIENYIGDHNGEELIELLRKEWNMYCLASEFNENFFATWSALGQGFVIVQSTDDYIVYLTNDFGEILDFIREHQDTSYALYEIKDGKLRNLGPSFLVLKTLENIKKR